MEYGNKILEEVLREIQAMTLGEYDKLHREACNHPDVEGISGSDFINEITFSQIGHMNLNADVFTTGADVYTITASLSLNVSSIAITLKPANSELPKAA